jgi:hypothetical protein
VSLTFFTDRDLGKQFPSILTAAGLAVVRHADLFAPDAPDEEWLARTGGEGWIGVTHDRRIRYKPNELAAVERHRVGLLIVVGRVPFPVLAQNFVNTRAQIEAFVEAEPRPFMRKCPVRALPTSRAIQPHTAA